MRAAANDAVVREAVETDVDGVRDLFVAAYGAGYPFKGFYDTAWLKHAVFDDDLRFLVAESDGKVVGAVSMMLAAGGLGDLIGELGRLVVHPSARGRDLATLLVAGVVEATAPVVRFGFAEARTAHPGSQKILERQGFSAVGFEPLKYTLDAPESVVFYARLGDFDPGLRRNHPRLIPEAAALAAAAMEGLGLAPDAIIADEAEGYPTPAPDVCGNCRVEELAEQGWSPLLRVERGRVRGREVFGNLSLSHGFFKIRNDTTRYLVARDGGAILGGIGLSHDPIDRKVRVFELIGSTDPVKGLLLAATVQLARERLGAVYLEIDVSADAPALQRTLERLGFIPVAYCPSMVFEGVERLDVLRMVKLDLPYGRAELPLTAAAARLRDLVERGMEDRRDGAVVAAAARSTLLFGGLPEGEVEQLARIGALRAVTAGEVLLRRGETGDRLLVVVSGKLAASVSGREVGVIGPGETAGEVALVDAGVRTADVVALEPGQVAEFRRDELVRLLDRRPRLGVAVMRNLAAGLAGKIRTSDERLAGGLGS